MTRFEKDYKDAKDGNEIEVITKRKAEIEKLRCGCDALRHESLARQKLRIMNCFLKAARQVLTLPLNPRLG